MTMEYELVKLHQYPHLLDECAQVLNEEWKRSHTARYQQINIAYKVDITFGY